MFFLIEGDQRTRSSYLGILKAKVHLIRSEFVNEESINGGAAA